MDIICDKDDLVGMIGFETDNVSGLIRSGSKPDTIRVASTVNLEKLIELRDRLIEMFPIDEKAEDVPEWRSDGEWREVTLEEAREGDYAEFDNTVNHSHDAGELKKWFSTLIIGKVVTPNINILHWTVRTSDGGTTSGMRNLRIWRKLDPHRFVEPKEEGYYATQSGIILRNDGDGRMSWYLLVGQGRDAFGYANWTEVLGQLDRSEFPLVRLTRESLRGIVAESRSRQ